MSEFTQPAHARLQILILQWIKDEIAESAPLFEEHKDADGDTLYMGVSLGEDSCLTANRVAMAATNAAYNVVNLGVSIATDMFEGVPK